MRPPYWQRLMALEAASAFGALLAFLAVDGATESVVTGTGLLVGGCPWPCESPHSWPRKVPTSVT